MERMRRDDPLQPLSQCMHEITEWIEIASKPRRCRGWAHRTGRCRETVHGLYLCADCYALSVGAQDKFRTALDSIPPRYQWAAYKHGSLVIRVCGGGDVIRSSHEVLDSGQWMCLWGVTGTGKTSLACAMLREVIEKGQGPNATRQERTRAALARYVEAQPLARARAALGLGRGDPAIVEEAMRASLLVIDELGSECDALTIREVIHARRARDLQTIITTNLSPDQIRAEYTDQTASRIMSGRVVHLRKTAIEEALEDRRNP